MTIHRSQGSEYPAVVIPLTTSAWMMLQRNLLYTAVTRAKKLVVLVGSRRALAQAVRTKGAGRRGTEPHPPVALIVTAAEQMAPGMPRLPERLPKSRPRPPATPRDRPRPPVVVRQARSLARDACHRP